MILPKDILYGIELKLDLVRKVTQAKQRNSAVIARADGVHELISLKPYQRLLEPIIATATFASSDSIGGEEGSDSISPPPPPPPPPPPAMPDPIAYYRFQDNGEDSSGNNHDLTMPGITDYIDGLLGRCVEYIGGTADQVPFAAGAGTGISLSIWFKIIHPAANRGTEIHLNYDGGTFGTNQVEFQWTEYGSSAGAGNLYIVSSGGSDSHTEEFENFDLDSWHHAVFTMDATVTKAYLDGVEIWSKATSDPVMADGTSYEIEITRIAGNGQPFDEAGWWNVALEASHVLELYNSGVGFDPTA